MSFTSIVISGGASKAVSVIGCIKWLEEQDLVSKIVHHIGTSAGAILCFYMVLGYSSQEIADSLKEMFSKPEITELFNMTDILNIATTLGASNGSNLIKLFQQILQRKTRQIDMTFMDLAKRFGKNLVVCVSNITEQREEFFSVDNVPDMSVIDALRITCGIPLLFTPVAWKNSYYIDGGLYCNFPMSYFEKALICNDINDILGINIKTKTQYSQNGNLLSYTEFIINSCLSKMNQVQCDLLSHKITSNNCIAYKSDRKNIVTIELEDVAWISLTHQTIGLSSQQIDDLVSQGYQIMTEHFISQVHGLNKSNLNT